jgi:MFS family permease
VTVLTAEPIAEATPPDRQRDFRLLWSGSATSQLGTMSAATASPLLALSLTGSPVFAGWVAAASTVPSLLLHLPAGLFVDRLNRRQIMLVSQFARFIVGALLVGGLFLVENHATLLAALLIVAAITDGTFAVFYNIAEITAVRRIAPSKKLSGAMAKNEARNHIALLVGRPLGGVLYGVSRALPYAVDALTCLLSIFALVSMETKDFQPAPESATRQATAPSGGIKSGLHLLLRDSFLRTVLVVCTITNFFFQTVVLLLVVLAEQEGLSSSLIGLLLAASGLGGLLGAIAAPRVLHKLRPKAIVIGCVWGWLPLAIVVAVSHQPIIGLMAWGCFSFMGAHMNVALAIYQAGVPEELLGRVASINSFLTSGAVPLGALSAGYIISELGTRAAAGLVAATVAVLAVVVPLSLLIGSARAPAAPTPVRSQLAESARAAQTVLIFVMVMGAPAAKFVISLLIKTILELHLGPIGAVSAAASPAPMRQRSPQLDES